MARKRKAPKPKAPLAVDPDAPVFQVGDEIVVGRNVLWTGYVGVVESVEGGMCWVRIKRHAGAPQSFLADIPARELKFLL